MKKLGALGVALASLVAAPAVCAAQDRPAVDRGAAQPASTPGFEDQLTSGYAWNEVGIDTSSSPSDIR